MRKILALCLALMTLCLCGCGKPKEELGVWQVPEIDTAPTVPTPTPRVQGGVTEPRIVWNDASEINMSDPGVENPPEEKRLNHKKTLALFPWSFLPASLFAENADYSVLSLEQSEHGVLLDENGALMENAYVQFRYLDKDKNEATAITVNAELISRERQIAIYDYSSYPHFRYPEGTQPILSRFGLESFLLHRCGAYRYAQIVLPLPKNVSADRVILLTVGSGLEVQDEALVDAVMELWYYQY